MKALYVRVYLTVLSALALFAVGSAWLFQHHVAQERVRAEAAAAERTVAWGELLQRSLPGPAAPVAEQGEAINEWSQRLHIPLALDDANGQRIATSERFSRRLEDARPRMRQVAVRLDDGRTLWVMRPLGPTRMIDADGGPHRPHVGHAVPELGGASGPVDRPGLLESPLLPGVGGFGLVLLLVLLFAAVAAGAYPVVRRLTRRLEALKLGVERFGTGELHHRVDTDGRDEVAAVAISFNRAAERIEALVRANQSLLANASHELRSPLARLKMAVSMLADTEAPAAKANLSREIYTNIGELDALVEEVLLASRLDAQVALDARDNVDVIALAAEEVARVDAVLEAEVPVLMARVDERLLRRAMRNLLENARRYAGGDVVLQLAMASPTVFVVRVLDRGPGVPPDLAQRIFEPFYRLPGHAEQAGGVGLGLSLVRQIAERHGGQVRCEPREGGGSAFVLELPIRGQ